MSISIVITPRNVGSGYVDVSLEADNIEIDCGLYDATEAYDCGVDLLSAAYEMLDFSGFRPVETEMIGKAIDAISEGARS